MMKDRDAKTERDMIGVKGVDKKGCGHNFVVTIAKSMTIAHLSNWGCSHGGNHGYSLGGDWSNAIGLHLRAVLGNVADLTASVAGLAPFAVQRAAVWCSAVAGDVSKFAAGVAFHCLGLTISGVMVWSTTFVASCSAWDTSEATTTAESGSTTISATRTTGAATDTTWDKADTWTSWASAVALGQISRSSWSLLKGNSRQGDLAVRMYSIFRWWHR